MEERNELTMFYSSCRQKAHSSKAAKTTGLATDEEDGRGRRVDIVAEIYDLEVKGPFVRSFERRDEGEEREIRGGTNCQIWDP